MESIGRRATSSTTIVDFYPESPANQQNSSHVRVCLRTSRDKYITNMGLVPGVLARLARFVRPIDGVVLSETRVDIHPPPRRLREIVLSAATGTREVGVSVKELTGWNAERVS